MQNVINALVAASPQGPASGDQQLAEHTAHALLTAAAAARDPELKTQLSKALAALHAYMTKISKEHDQAMAGKMSPRLMRGS